MDRKAQSREVYPTTTALTYNATKTKPQHLSIGMPPAFPAPKLIVVHFDGSTECTAISKRVAAILIASGISHQG